MYRLAADQGHVGAQYYLDLGVCYEFGDGVAINEQEAVKYYEYKLATES